MHCPGCGSCAKVQNSRNSRNENSRRMVPLKYTLLGEDLTVRQHKCKHCGMCFDTVEIHADSFFDKLKRVSRRYIARDNQREKFNE